MQHVAPDGSVRTETVTERQPERQSSSELALIRSGSSWSFGGISLVFRRPQRATRTDARTDRRTELQDGAEESVWLARVVVVLVGGLLGAA